MEIIAPNGERKEVPLNPKSEEKAPPPLQANIDKDGWMTIKVNLPVIASSADLFCTMRGFLDSERDRAMQAVNQMRAEAAKAGAQILKAKNQGLFNGFLHKLRR